MGLRDQLQSIYDQHGALTPQLVVDAARPKDHPLHDRVFDRSRPEAADAWYLYRADTLIKSVTTRRALPSGETVDLRAFSPTRGDQPGVYDPLEVIAADPVASRVLLQMMYREWQGMYKRYGHLQEFLEVVRQDTESAA